MSGARHWEQDKDSTIYIGNLDERVTDALIWELFLQSGRIANVHLPKDRVTQSHQGYGFVEFTSEEDADYAARIMNQVRLFGKPIRVNKASADKQKSVEVGAELFIGNLDPMVDERMLYDTFGRFGTLVAQPKIARDESNLSKGYGFVSYSNFEASDDAIANMHDQYLMNKNISVQYAYKKDGKGERHGDTAERMLAAQAKAHGVQPTPATIPLGGAATPAMFGTPATPTLPPNFNQMPLPMPLPNGNYQNIPPPQTQRPPPPPPAPLSAPPSGLPARPPPSQAGYGGPQGFMPGMGMPQGFGAPQQQLPAGFAPPPGFGSPNPGQVPPAGLPPGFQGYGIRK
jgi:splicing factor 3B subunit 4